MLLKPSRVKNCAWLVSWRGDGHWSGRVIGQARKGDIRIWCTVFKQDL